MSMQRAGVSRRQKPEIGTQVKRLRKKNVVPQIATIKAIPIVTQRKMLRVLLSSSRYWNKIEILMAKAETEYESEDRKLSCLPSVSRFSSTIRYREGYAQEDNSQSRPATHLERASLARIEALGKYNDKYNSLQRSKKTYKDK